MSSRTHFKTIIALTCFYISLAFISGCTLKYAPKLYPIKKFAMPNISSNKPVSVINVLKNCSKEILIGKIIDRFLVYNISGDLSKCTETAAELLKSELSNKNIQINDDAFKTLKLEVVDANITYEFYVYYSLIELKVETGNGYIRNYIATNKSGLFDRSIDGAITWSVTAMLNDDKIIDYITK